MQRLIDAHGPAQRPRLRVTVRFEAPPRDLSGWVDTERLARLMLDEWLIAPGALFHATRRSTTPMRINFATSQDVRFRQAVAIARAKVG